MPTSRGHAARVAFLWGFSPYSFALLPYIGLRFSPDGSWALHFQYAGLYADLWFFSDSIQGDTHGL